MAISTGDFSPCRDGRAEASGLRESCVSIFNYAFSRLSRYFTRLRFRLGVWYGAFGLVGWAAAKQSEFMLRTPHSTGVTVDRPTN